MSINMVQLDGLLQALNQMKLVSCRQAAKVMGVKAHTEQDSRQVMLDLYLR